MAQVHKGIFIERLSKPLKGERNVKRHQIVVKAMQLRG